MKYDRKKNPVACVAKESSRYAVTGVAVVKHGERHYVAATDGRCLSMVACELESEDPSTVGHKTYPREVFDAARKHKGPVSLELNGKATLRTMEGTVTEYPAIECRFPDVVAVVPNVGKRHPTVGLSVARLLAIAEALGTDMVQLTFNRNAAGDGIDNETPMLVQPIYVASGATEKERKRAALKLAEQDGSFGVLMPVSV